MTDELHASDGSSASTDGILSVDADVTALAPVEDAEQGGVLAPGGADSLPGGWRVADSVPAHAAGKMPVLARDYYTEDGRLKTWILYVEQTDDGWRVVTPTNGPDDWPTAKYQVRSEAENYTAAFMEEHPTDADARAVVQAKHDERRQRELEREEARMSRPKFAGGYPNHEHGSQVDFDALRRAGIDGETANRLLKHYDSLAEIQAIGEENPRDVIDEIDKLGERRFQRVLAADAEDARDRLAGGADQASLTDFRDPQFEGAVADSITEDTPQAFPDGTPS